MISSYAKIKLDKTVVDIMDFHSFSETFLQGILAVPCYGLKLEKKPERYCKLTPKRFRTLCGFLVKIIDLHDKTSLSYEEIRELQDLEKAVELLIGADEGEWFSYNCNALLFVKCAPPARNILIYIDSIRRLYDDMRVYSKYDLT